MPYETDFDTAFTILLGKAQNTITPTPTPAPVITPPSTVTTYTLNFLFGNGSSALTASGQNPLLAEVPDSGEIVWAHLYAGNSVAVGVNVTATVDLWRTFGTLTNIWGSGTKPTLTSQSSANMSLVGWFPHLDAGEQVIAKLATFSGTATWLSLVLRVRRDSA